MHFALPGSPFFLLAQQESPKASVKMPKASVFVRNDRHYKEVRRTIARNQKKKQEADETPVEES